MVIFHSSGGVGSDNLLPLNAFTRAFGSAESRRDFPAYVLVPQTPGRTANYEKDGHGVRISKAGADLPDVMRLVEDIARHHPIDARRIYAVGFSMGASAALDAAAASPGASRPSSPCRACRRSARSPGRWRAFPRCSSTAPPTRRIPTRAARSGPRPSRPRAAIRSSSPTRAWITASRRNC
ncbi:hypothetical protein WJ972_34690 [Achromobacter insuavis]